jgi:2-(1,2-epoxy-1,2-dihydrophenyl)acetyl-CoA isomerase
MQSITKEVENGVATITLSRADVYNSFNREMALLFHTALDECNEDDEVRCIVITGAGKAFCAGQDLNEVIDPEGPELLKIVEEHYNPIIKRIRKIEKPIVAAVNGVAAGAGANIALACDIVIAKESASFIQAFSKIGLIPDSGGTFFLPRLVGWQRASALTILGDKVTAAEAEKMGMIYKAVPDENYDDFIAAISYRLSKMPTKGIGLTKRALNASLTNDLDKQLVIEEQLQFAASQTEDYNEGVNAFLEKRKPLFTGK